MSGRKSLRCWNFLIIKSFVKQRIAVPMPNNSIAKRPADPKSNSRRKSGQRRFRQLLSQTVASAQALEDGLLLSSSMADLGPRGWADWFRDKCDCFPAGPSLSSKRSQSSRKRSSLGRSAQLRRRLLMTERLEDRTLLAVVTWVGDGSDLNWNNPANWSTGVLPGADDDVEIADIAPDIAIFHSSGATSIKSLTSHEALVISGGTLEIAAASSISDTLNLGNSSSAILTGTGEITVDGLFTWTGGRLQGTGTLMAGGGMLIEGGSTKYLERTVDNTGTAIWTGGTISATAEGVFNNLVGATFDAQSNNPIAGTFNNAGTLLKSAGTSFSSFSTMNNTGLVQVQSGTLAVSGGGNSSGSFEVDADSALQFSSGTHVWDANATSSGAGALKIINNATLDVASNISIGNLDVLRTSSSTSVIPVLTGIGDVTVDGLFTWTGGRLQGSGKLIAGGGMLIDGSSTKYQDRTIDNGGVATWTDGEIRASAGMEFNNLAGATFDAQSDDLFQFTTATFNNAGTLLKSAGTGLSRFLTAMNNTGTVHAQAGTLELGGGGSSSGSFQIDTGSTLRLSAGTHVFHDGWSVTGEGNLLVSGGTLEAASSGSIDNLELGNSSSAFLTGDGDVTVDGLFTWTGGRLQGTGTLMAGGGMLIEGGSTKYLERTVDNTGTAIWTGGTISATAEGVFNNLVGATFDAQSNNPIAGTFNNAGTLLKSAGTSFSSFSTMNNTGLVQVQSGTLAVSGGGNSSGSFEVDADSALQFSSGTHVWDANATSSGAGTLKIINNATLDVASNISIGNLDVLRTSSSTSVIPVLTGIGDVTVDGLFTWTGGRLQGSGKLIAGGGMLIDGSSTKYQDRTIDNGGVATWTDGEIRASAGMEFNNLAGATFDAQSDDLFQFTTATFNNAGTLLKSAGTGLSRFLTAMNNTGTVHAQAGTLELGGGGSSSGSFQIDTGSTLRLSAGTHVFHDGWSVTGEGNLLVSGGTLEAASSGSIDNLELGNSSSAFLTGDGDVTVDGLFTWTGGRLQGTGTLMAGGGMLIEGGSTKYLERTVDNTGTAIWTGGTISATAEGVFNNLVGATFDAQSNNPIAGTFNNAGTLLKSAGTSFSSFSTMNNTGLVQVQSGTLAVSGGGNSSGSFEVDADSALQFSSGTHVWDANATSSGAGTLKIINNATLDVASNISIGNLDVLRTSSSTSVIPVLTGIGDVTVDGLFTGQVADCKGRAN